MHRVSPTQISDHRLCERKNLWKFVVGIRPPPNASALLGQRVHKQFENYLDNKFNPFEDQQAADILLPALEFLPAAADDVESEQEVEFTLHGVKFVGRFDARNSEYIFDLKTTKDAKWAKIERELIVDPQAIIYSLASQGKKCKWVYTLTGKKRKAWPVAFQPVQSGPVMDQIVADAKRIMELVEKRQLPLLHPPGPPEACTAYGGCAFREYCTDLSPLRGLLRRAPSMGMKDIMAKMQQSLQPVSPAKETKQQELPMTAAINPPESAEAGPPPLPETVKAKRGRKKVEPVEPTPSPEGEPSSGTEVELSIAMLFVDCIPHGNSIELMDLSSAIADAHMVVKRDANVPDYRLIDFSGAGIMRIAVLEVLKNTEANKVGNLNLFIDTKTPEAKLVLNDLKARSALVIQGI